MSPAVADGPGVDRRPGGGESGHSEGLARRIRAGAKDGIIADGPSTGRTRAARGRAPIAAGPGVGPVVGLARAGSSGIYVKVLRSRERRAGNVSSCDAAKMEAPPRVLLNSSSSSLSSSSRASKLIWQ